jgi:FAD-linked sulfhydryl oxidase
MLGHAYTNYVPMQTSNRRAAAMWLCFVHNLVNKRLGKLEYPCDKLEGDYDCGCGDPEAGTAPYDLPVDSMTGEEVIRGG